VASRRTTKVDLAGPDVFLPDAIEIGRRKCGIFSEIYSEICVFDDINGLYPLDSVIGLKAADASLNIIFKGNEAMMDAADAIIANLTLFRGSGAGVERLAAAPAKG
jgi:nucleoside 2-deoxyribosyltransferase